MWNLIVSQYSLSNQALKHIYEKTQSPHAVLPRNILAGPYSAWPLHAILWRVRFQHWQNRSASVCGMPLKNKMNHNAFLTREREWERESKGVVTWCNFSLDFQSTCSGTVSWLGSIVVTCKSKSKDLKYQYVLDWGQNSKAWKIVSYSVLIIFGF